MKARGNLGANLRRQPNGDKIFSSGMVRRHGDARRTSTVRCRGRYDSRRHPSDRSPSMGRDQNSELGWLMFGRSLLLNRRRATSSLDSNIEIQELRYYVQV